MSQRIQLICFGKLKEPHWRAAAAEYEKRLGAFCKLELLELPAAPLPEHPSPAQLAKALEQEAKLALPKILNGAAVAALCPEGRQMDSENFSRWMDGRAVAFLIGSSCGMSEQLKARAELRLSFSPMTFPHELARVMLLEQIYRAHMILSGGKYHK